MKNIGLLGGMSWESTQHYYQLINQGVNKQLGGHNSAQIVLNSVNFATIEQLQKLEDWPAMAKILIDAARNTEAAGADCLLICTNTMHKVAPEISASLTIPLLHIADATAKQLQKDNITQVGLLGTQYTMEQDFYKGRLTDKFDIKVLVPERKDREIIHQVIYQELCLGKITPQAKAAYITIINQLHQQGAQAIILGCTEIGLLLKQPDTVIPLYDTTKIHAAAAIEFALSD